MSARVKRSNRLAVWTSDDGVAWKRREVVKMPPCFTGDPLMLKFRRTYMTRCISVLPLGEVPTLYGSN